jgi:carotenoid cleavage dioxygenase
MVSISWVDGVIEPREISSIEGAWPQELQGSLLQNGPGLLQRAGESKHHLFDGDGLIQRWQINNKGISYQSKFVQTNKFVREQREGKFIYADLSSSNPNGRQIRRPDDINPANTNIFDVNGKFFALWEAGSAHEFDPDTLDTLGVHQWSDETAGAPFGAHPKRDSEGNTWNIGTTENILILYVISPLGELKGIKSHPIKTSAIVHDFVITDRHLAVWLAPLDLDHDKLQSGSPLLDAMTWHEDKPSRLVVIERKTLEIKKTFEFEAELVFHFANGWDDDEALCLHYVKINHKQFQYGLLLPPVYGEMEETNDWSISVLRRVNLQTGKSEIETFDGFVEFPQIDKRWNGKKHKFAFYLERREPRSHATEFNALLRQDLTSGKQTRYQFPESVQIDEHIHVPLSSSAQEAEGWLIGTGYNARLNASFCSVFEAASIEQGPIAIAYLNGRVPACFHGFFSKDIK